MMHNFTEIPIINLFNKMQKLKELSQYNYF